MQQPYHAQEVSYGQKGDFYLPPPPPPPNYVGGPTIISVGTAQRGSGSPCPFCQRNTPNITEKTVGVVTFFWACVLFLCTGWLCFIPFVVDSCKDTEILCATCHRTKITVPAQCCWFKKQFIFRLFFIGFFYKTYFFFVIFEPKVTWLCRGKTRRSFKKRKVQENKKE